jgi:lysyl-tRNA synthetase class 2
VSNAWEILLYSPVMTANTQQLLRTLRARARTMAVIRGFFTGRGYLEVDTPLLAPALIPESTLEVFATTQLPAPGEPAVGPRRLFLIPSPELWMKRVLAAGSGSIFQICRSFRNCEPSGPLHSPEFAMLEWYTVGATYMDSMDTVEDLLAALVAAFGGQTGSAELLPPFVRLSMNEAFARHLGTSLEDLLSPQQMRDALRARGLSAAPDDSWADGFHKLFLACVEPALPRGRPVILYDYPAAIPTLARRKGDSPWAERWELYARGVEVANCYSEETDPVQLRSIFAEQALNKRGARVPHPPDDGLLKILEKGFPACSGTALGLDRLLMLLLGAESIAATGLTEDGAAERSPETP